MMRTVEIPRKSKKDLIRALLMMSQLILMDQSKLGEDVAGLAVAATETLEGYNDISALSITCSTANIDR